MAVEGVVANPGVGGSEFAVDEVSGGSGTVLAPYVKLMSGTDGAADVIPGGAGGLLVDLGANNDVTVTGSVTVSATNLDIRDLSSAADSVAAAQSGTWTVIAEAGTNLNTSALALESGGNLAAIATSCAILDDWDESDRAKVNLIVGQAGIAAGTGTDGATVPRVTLATNVPLPAGTNLLGSVNVLPATAGGWSVLNATSSDGATALTATAQVIKGSAGQLGGWFIYNPNVAAQFVQIYNTAAASVTVGTTVPLMMLTIPAASAANLELTNGIAFSSAFSCAATSTAGGNGSPSTALDANFFFK